MTTISTERLSPRDSRRVLSELAGWYTAEASSNDRPITVALPVLLRGLVDHALRTDEAVDLFDRFAAARAVSGRADATDGAMLAAERRADELLARLLGGAE